MKNFVQKGNIVTVPAPAGGATSGVPFEDGPAGFKMLFVPQADADAGDDVACVVEDVVALAKDGTDTFEVGEPLYWDESSKQAQKSASTFFICATCVKAAAASDGTVWGKLTGQTAALVP